MLPTYPFKCDECGYEEEILCKIAEKDNYKNCPKCGSEWSQIMCYPGLVVIHDCQGIADLHYKRVMPTGGKAFNTTKGENGRYYFKNNPSEDPRVIQRKMESD